MAQTVITENGDFFLATEEDAQVTQTDASTVLVLENSAGASLLFGVGDENDSFVPYPNGAFTDGKRIRHGRGARLMVRASEISADSVTIRVFRGA